MEANDAAELRQRRETVRIGLARASAAAFGAVLIVILLAIVAIVAAFRVEERAAEAQRITEHFWKDSTLRARASRINNELGGRAEALDTLRTAAKVRATQELRNEAVSALALDDFRETGDFCKLPNAPHAYFNSDFSVAAYETADHRVVVTNLLTGQQLIRQYVPDWYVHPLLFSPDDQLFAARSANVIKVWSLSNRTSVLELKKEIPGHQVDDSSLAFSADSRSIAYGTRSGSIHVHDIDTGVETHELRASSRVGALSYSPDGRRLAVGVFNSLKLWNFEAEIWEVLLVEPTANLVRCIAWSPDGRFVAAGTRGKWVYVCDTQTGAYRSFRDHGSVVEKIDFHPAGDLIATGDGAGVTRVWDFWTGNAHLVTDRGVALRFNERGDRLAYLRRADGIGTWKIRRSPVFRSLAIVRGEAKGFSLVEISRRGDHIIVPQNEGLNFLRLDKDLSRSRHLGFKPFPMADGPTRRGVLSAIPHPNQPGWVTMSEQGPSVLRVVINEKTTATDLQAAEWEFPAWPVKRLLRGANANFDRNKILCRTTHYPSGVIFDPLRAGPPRTITAEHGMTDIALSAQDRWLAQGVGTWLRGAHIRDFATGKLLADIGESGMKLAFSPDSKHFVTGGLAHFDIWDTRTWQRRHRVTKGSIGFESGDAVFAPDSRTLALAYSADLIQILDVESGQPVTTLHSPDRAGLNAIRFTPDGEILVASTKEVGVHLWQLKRLNEELRKLGLDSADIEATQSRSTEPAAPRLFGQLTLHQTMMLIGLGVLITVGLALFTLRRHRRLLRTYLDIEGLAAERNEALADAQAESLQNQKMKALGTLAAGMAHDFNNLLSVIRMSNQLTLERLPEEDEIARANLGLIEKSVAQGKGVVRSILGYSREPGESEGLSIDDLVESTVAMLGAQFLSGIQLKMRLESDLPETSASKSGLQQILLNLIVNASDAMDGKGRLDIDVNTVRAIDGDCVLRPANAERWIQLRVSDSGHGIPNEIRERVFEPFFTTKAKSATPGAGLGLSTIYTVAERDGLGIQLTSSRDAGTVFRILIPVNKTTKRSP